MAQAEIDYSFNCVTWKTKMTVLKFPIGFLCCYEVVMLCIDVGVWGLFLYWYLLVWLVVFCCLCFVALFLFFHSFFKSYKNVFRFIARACFDPNSRLDLNLFQPFFYFGWKCIRAYVKKLTLTWISTFPVYQQLLSKWWSKLLITSHWISVICLIQIEIKINFGLYTIIFRNKSLLFGGFISCLWMSREEAKNIMCMIHNFIHWELTYLVLI